MSVEDIKSILGKIFNEKGEDFYVSERNLDIEAVWNKIVPEKTRAHTYVLKVNFDRLVVKVDSSCYLTDLKFKEKVILDQLWDAGWSKIKKIEFII